MGIPRPRGGVPVTRRRCLRDQRDTGPPGCKGRGRPRKRISKSHTDTAHGHHRRRRALGRGRIQHCTGRCGIEPSCQLGRHRWMVERMLAWFTRCWRLAVCRGPRQDIRLAAAGIVRRFTEKWIFHALKGGGALGSRRANRAERCDLDVVGFQHCIFLSKAHPLITSAPSRSRQCAKIFSATD